MYKKERFSFAGSYANWAFIFLLFFSFGAQRLLAQDTGIPAEDLLQWTFDGCDEAQGFSSLGTTVLGDGGCVAVEGTELSNLLGSFVCADTDDGQAVCFPGRTDPFPRDDAVSFDDEKTISFSITMTPAEGKLGYLTEIEFLLTSAYQDIGNFAEGWAVRASIEGEEVFNEIDLDVESDFWETMRISFSDNDAFQFSETTTFDFEIISYGFLEDVVFHFDNMIVRGGCIDDVVTFPEGDVALKKLLDNRGQEEFEGGEQVRFLVRAHNQGDFPITDVTMIDYLPAGWTLGRRSVEYGWVLTTDLNGDPAATLTSDFVIQPGLTKTHPLFLIAPHIDQTLRYAIGAEIVSAFSLDGLEIIDIDSDLDADPFNDFNVDNVIDNSSGDEDDSDFAVLLVLGEEEHTDINKAVRDKLQQDKALPEQTALLDSYPNPFNPVTNVAYQITEQTHVRLAVYDIHGRLVKELVNGEMPAGQHEVVFEAEALASGTYFYTLEAENQRFTKSFLFMK